MVAVVYWSACLAVNEEVRVRSPPVTRNSGALPNGGQLVLKTGVVVMQPQGFDSSALPRMSLSSSRPRTPPFQGGNAGSNPARDARRPRQVERGQRYERRPWRFESSRGYQLARSTKDARVRFAPSPLLLPWTEQLGGELQPRHMPVQVRPGAPSRGQGVVRGTPGSQLGRAGAVPADRSNSIF